MDETGKEQFGDKWKGAVVVAKDDENVAVYKVDKDNKGSYRLEYGLKGITGNGLQIFYNIRNAAEKKKT